MKSRLFALLFALVFILSGCNPSDDNPIDNNPNDDNQEVGVQITFETDGGTDIAPIEVNEDGTYTMPVEPTKSGFDFDGWYTDINFFYPFDSSNLIEEDIILYAKWLEQEECVTIGTKCLDVSLQDEHTITIYVYGGSGTYYEDIGHDVIPYSDFGSRIEAEYYAVAKQFNRLYPNITINLYADRMNPSSYRYDFFGIRWELENQFGITPTIWMTNNVVEMMNVGMIADLSIMKEDMGYQNINPQLMSALNYYGFQAGLPYNVIVDGVYINKSLADNKGISYPDPDWTIDEYTEFVSHSVTGEYYGLTTVPMSFVYTGTTNFAQSIFNKETSPTIQVNSSEMQSLLAYTDTWNQYGIYGDFFDEDFLMETSENKYKLFAEGYALTHASDSFLLEQCLSQSSKNDFLNCEMDEFDYYPRPSTEFQDNTIGIFMEPLVVSNFCNEDNNSTCSDEELMEIYVNYAFLSFLVQDSRALSAKIHQDYRDDLTANGIQLPVTTGDLFEEQMDIWFEAPYHNSFADEETTPGFHKILELYESGTFWDPPYYTYPLAYYENAKWHYIFNEFNSAWYDHSTTLEAILGSLDNWNTEFNAHLDDGFERVRDALEQYYNYDSSDFE